MQNFPTKIHVNDCTKFIIHNYIYFYKKRSPLTHLRNQFKSMNTFEQSYDYKITLIRRGKNPLSPFWELSSPYSDAMCQIGLEVAQWFWRRRWFNLVNVFLLFHNYHSSKRVWPFIGTKLNPIHQKNMLCTKFGWKWSSGCFIKFCQCIFTILQLSSLGKGHGPSWSIKLTLAFISGELKKTNSAALQLFIPCSH